MAIGSSEKSDVVLVMSVGKRGLLRVRVGGACMSGLLLWFPGFSVGVSHVIKAAERWAGIGHRKGNGY